MEILGKTFNTEKEYLDFIVENESLIIDTKKSTIKEADGFGGGATILRTLPNSATKSNVAVTNEDVIKVKAIINTTNILDSHMDVHIKGLWNKSLKERADKILHLQEHRRSFKDVISRGNDLKAYVESGMWKDLGFDLDGETEALTFDSMVRKSRNEEMFKAYRDGDVTEHSVGMQYIKMATCINDEDYPVQKENWDKYAPMVANKEALEETKVFWAVTEAKAIEGSAVLMGSNSFTPTVSNSAKSTTIDNKENPYKSWLGL